MFDFITMAYSVTFPNFVALQPGIEIDDWVYTK